MSSYLSRKLDVKEGRGFFSGKYGSLRNNAGYKAELP
jgi:hypothetical protein